MATIRKITLPSGLVRWQVDFTDQAGKRRSKLFPRRKDADGPDLNPIEMAFSKLKTLVRKATARTYDQLWAAVGHVCDLFSDEECYNYFKAAGYEAT